MPEPQPGERGWIDTKDVKFGDTRAQKGIKSMGQLFKSAGKAAHPIGMAVSAIKELGSQIGIMDALMAGLKPLFDIVNSLLSVFSNSIMQAIMPALQPLIDMLPDLIPIIQQIGQLIGWTIAIGLEPIMMLLEALMPIIEPLIGVIVSLTELAFVPLMVILEVLGPILEALAPVFELIAIALTALQPIIDWLAMILSGVFIWTLKAISFGFAVLIDVFTLGLAGATNAVVKWWAEIEGKDVEPIENEGIPGETYAQRKERQMIFGDSYQSGTEMILRSGLVQVEAGEAIQPAGLVGTSEALLQELVELNVMQERRAKRERFFGGFY